MKRLRFTLVLAFLSFALLNSTAVASFGVSEFDVKFTKEDGSPATQAGSHPFAVTANLAFTTEPGEPQFPEADVKDIDVTNIEGLVGRPGVTPRCPEELFLDRPGGSSEGAIESACPDATAVGVIIVDLEGVEYSDAVYNLRPPPGAVAKVGFVTNTVPVTIEFRLNSKPPYNVVARATDVPQVLPVISSKLTLWGVPASPTHDPYRGACLALHASATGELRSRGSCPSSAGEEPFLTLPRACNGPLQSRYTTDSWDDPGALLPDGEADLSDPRWISGLAETNNGASPPSPRGFGDCEALRFKPSITAEPTARGASSPTGLDFALNLQNEGLLSTTGLANSEPEKAVVTLPEGMTANPALAEGLSACSEEALSRETADSAPGEGCPNESKIGTVEVETPLLEKPLNGSLFIATPYANPFGSLLALYFVIKDPELGIIVKQPAEVIPDKATGRITTVVDDIPQLPFSHFKLHFREGARSPLVTPPACGTYLTTAQLTPWSAGPPVTTSSSFQVIVGPGGSPCPSGGKPQFEPRALAGTQNNSAASYSPFYLRVERDDGEQEITKFTTQLPPGLTGNLSGIPFCPDSAIEAARSKTGAQELIEPSCPAASKIGHTLVGAGVGPVLAYTPGSVYLAGPYHGSALSIVSITSAKVGPFDLGTVVIRFALRIDPITAQVEVDSSGSDPIPHIIDGIVVNVRDIHVYIDREHFILNPTSCAPMAISDTITGAGENIVDPGDDTTVVATGRFQAANCQSLGFKPSFKVSTSGKTSRRNGASLSVRLTYPSAPQGTQANIAKVKVDLPKQLPSRLTTLQQACPAAQFEANPAGCPSASRVGSANAITPILPVPLTGPAYFVSHGGAKFPELVMVLQGYGIMIDLHGETFINKAGITSSTFRTVPDQPVTSFELTLPEGKYSALAANGNLCATKLNMPTAFTAQNGATLKQTTKITVTGCPRHKAKKTKAKKNRKKGKR